jgi:RNA polymerase sigma-70 factor (ECF subfamily)
MSEGAGMEVQCRPVGDSSIAAILLPGAGATAKSTTDEALMEGYVRGDGHAFEQLFARLAPRVHGFFMRSFRDTVIADELLQTTFLRVHRGRGTYHAGSPVRPWLFAIAARVRRDELRRKYRIKEDSDEEALAEAENAYAHEGRQASHHADEVAETIDIVRAALDRLPESQRIVIQLHRYREMRFHEIAAVLGLSEVAVRARAFRAYEELRKELLPLLRH